MKENIIFNSDINVITESMDKEKKTIMRGVAVDTGVSRNKVRYLPDELEKSAETLIGKPILDGHDDKSVKNIVGKVIGAKFMNNQIFFEALMDSGETDIIRKLENGFINKVSIGASYDEPLEIDKEGIATPTNLQFEELSLVVTPGVNNATIHQVIAEQLNKKIGDKVTENLVEIKELQKKIAELEEEKKLREQEDKEVATAVKEAQNEANIDEQKKIVTSLEEKINKLESKFSEKSKIVEDSSARKGFKFIEEKTSRPGAREFYASNPEELY